MDVLRLDVLTWAAGMKETLTLSKLLASGRWQGLSPRALGGTTAAEKHCRAETDPGSPARGVQVK